MLSKLPPDQRVKVKMSPREKSFADIQANNINKKVGNNNMGDKKGHLGKNSFLKLLVTQLKHQDPTKPLEDKQFIAQMAQFSTLEQMNNIGREFKELIQSSKTSEANSFLGKRVDAFDSTKNVRVSGVVSSIRYNNDNVSLIVGNKEVSMKHVHAVYDADKNTNNSVIKSFDKKH